MRLQEFGLTYRQGEGDSRLGLVEGELEHWGRDDLQLSGLPPGYLPVADPSSRHVAYQPEWSLERTGSVAEHTESRQSVKGVDASCSVGVHSSLVATSKVAVPLVDVVYTGYYTPAVLGHADFVRTD